MTDVVPASSELSLTLKNKEGLMIPSEGAAEVSGIAECFICQLSGRAVKVSLIDQFFRAEKRSENVFCLKRHIESTATVLCSCH